MLTLHIIISVWELQYYFKYHEIVDQFSKIRFLLTVRFRLFVLLGYFFVIDTKLSTPNPTFYTDLIE